MFMAANAACMQFAFAQRAPPLDALLQPSAGEGLIIAGCAQGDIVDLTVEDTHTNAARMQRYTLALVSPEAEGAELRSHSHGKGKPCWVGRGLGMEAVACKWRSCCLL